MELLILFIFVPGLVALLLVINPLIAPKESYSEKLSAYECGFSPVLGQGRAPLTISFYLVGILYLVFDLEVAFLVPLAGALNIVGISGYSIAIIFIIILTAGFVFEIGSGALYWADQKDKTTRI
jgi:NADH:ubiquinone oxidoreductase subunit 3 (subunit A)